MRKAILVGSSAVAFGLLSGAALAQTQAPSTPGTAGATKMSQAECAALWNRVDSGKSGNVSETQLKPYITNFKAIDTNGDNKVSQSEFQSGCDKGLVHSSASTGAGSGTMAPGSKTPPATTTPKK